MHCVLQYTGARTYRLSNLLIFASRFYRLVDNLPVATATRSSESKEAPNERDQYEHGYRLGQIDDHNVYINNHLKFVLSYHMHTK